MKWVGKGVMTLINFLTTDAVVDSYIWKRDKGKYQVIPVKSLASTQLFEQ